MLAFMQNNLWSIYTPDGHISIAAVIGYAGVLLGVIMWLYTIVYFTYKIIKEE